MMRTLARSFALLLGLPIVLAAPDAWAQSIIKEPGNHPNYGVELDPHVVGQYGSTPYSDGGFGVGFRASIPFVHNGPVPKINNNIGITFGIDWVHFGDDDYCNGRGYVAFFPDSCSATDLWFPVAAQWNFFLTPIISVFGELGLAMRYTRWSYEGTCLGPGSGQCDASASHFDPFEPVLWGGGRFLFAKTVGMTVRLGWPYISVGATFLL